MIDYTMSSIEKQSKINRYADVVTIDVEREHATQLADCLVGMNCEVTEVRLQHALLLIMQRYNFEVLTV